MSTYKVIGPFAYREHPVGSVFSAELTPPEEQRALHRGNVRLLKKGPLTVDPGSYRLPRGWKP